ncbi:hypothetical protein RhiLY_08995 [Ceratobasidium sp. AG-Ba]|nr:hypothetical protein RhiLY_08995 [Ceratobasidium sp. AG-Ba]
MDEIEHSAEAGAGASRNPKNQDVPILPGSGLDPNLIAGSPETEELTQSKRKRSDFESSEEDKAETLAGSLDASICAQSLTPVPQSKAKTPTRRRKVSASFGELSKGVLIGAVATWSLLALDLV